MASSRGNRDGGDGDNGWCVLNGILMAMEIPGIYLRTDREEVYVFDGIEAQVLKRDKKGVTLKLTNPTKFNAQLAILAESAEQGNKPLGTTAFLKRPKVQIKSGATIEMTFK